MTHQQKFKKTKSCPKLGKTAMSSPATSTRRHRASCKELATTLKLKIGALLLKSRGSKKGAENGEVKKLAVGYRCSRWKILRSGQQFRAQVDDTEGISIHPQREGTVGHLMLLLKCLKKPSYQSHSSMCKQFED